MTESAGVIDLIGRAGRYFPRFFRSAAPPTTPAFFQIEPHECGVICLRMILAYHGVHVPVAELRKTCGTGREGFRLDYLAKTARQ